MALNAVSAAARAPLQLPPATTPLAQGMHRLQERLQATKRAGEKRQISQRQLPLDRAQQDEPVGGVAAIPGEEGKG
jgi:hypothetical protein